MRSHAWFAAVAVTRPPIGPNALAHLDSSLRALSGLGWPLVEVSRLLGTVTSFVTGVVAAVAGFVTGAVATVAGFVAGLASAFGADFARVGVGLVTSAVAGGTTSATGAGVDGAVLSGTLRDGTLLDGTVPGPVAADGVALAAGVPGAPSIGEFGPASPPRPGRGGSCWLT
jgi:hypothetical protein